MTPLLLIALLAWGMLIGSRSSVAGCAVHLVLFALGWWAGPRLFLAVRALLRRDIRDIVGAVALALLSSYMAQPVAAQDVSSPGWMNLSARWGSYTWVQYQASADAPDRSPVPGTRVQGSVTIGRLYLGARLDTSAYTVGEESYTSIEGYALGAIRVSGPIAIAGTWGYIRPTLGSRGQDVEVVGGGLYASPGLRWNGNAEAWAFAGALHRRTLDGSPLDEPRWRPVVAFQVPVKERTSAVGEAMPGRAWVYRVGVAYRLR